MGDNYRSLVGARRGSSSVTQYRSVLLGSTAFQVDPVTNANASRPIGVLQNDPGATNEPADVAYDGICRAEYGGNVSVGNTLINNNNGQLIADVEVADGSAVDVHHVATALEAGGSGEVHYILLHTPVRIGLE